MKIPAGAPGWYDACSAVERVTTLALATSRWKWSLVWSMVAATGVVLCLCLSASGVLPVPWTAAEIMHGPVVFALCALLLDLAVLVPSCVAWAQVRRVFSGAAPDEVVRPFRWLRWAPTALVSLFGTVAMVVAGAYPIAAMGAEGLGMPFTAWLTAVVAVLCLLCGLSTMYLKAILRPVRT